MIQVAWGRPLRMSLGEMDLAMRTGASVLIWIAPAVPNNLTDIVSFVLAAIPSFPQPNASRAHHREREEISISDVQHLRWYLNSLTECTLVAFWRANDVANCWIWCCLCVWAVKRVAPFLSYKTNFHQTSATVFHWRTGIVLVFEASNSYARKKMWCITNYERLRADRPTEIKKTSAVKLSPRAWYWNLSWFPKSHKMIA